MPQSIVKNMDQIEKRKNIQELTFMNRNKVILDGMEEDQEFNLEHIE